MKKILLLITFVLLGFAFTRCDNDELFASYSITGKIYSGGETQVGCVFKNFLLSCFIYLHLRHYKLFANSSLQES